MPNAILTKDDGLTVVMPASSITAVLGSKDPNRPDAKSLIFTTFQGFSMYHLKDPALVVFEKVQKASDDAQEWLELIALDDDKSYLNPMSPFGVEQVHFNGEVCTKVFFRRHDGQESWTIVDGSEFEKIFARLNPEPEAAPEKSKKEA